MVILWRHWPPTIRVRILVSYPSYSASYIVPIVDFTSCLLLTPHTNWVQLSELCECLTCFWNTILHQLFWNQTLYYISIKRLTVLHVYANHHNLPQPLPFATSYPFLIHHWGVKPIFVPTVCWSEIITNIVHICPFKPRMIIHIWKELVMVDLMSEADLYENEVSDSEDWFLS